MSLYIRYFDLLDEEQSRLEELYEPLRKQLVGGDKHKRILDFRIRRSVDSEGWSTSGEQLINRRMKGPFQVRGQLEEYARRKLEPAWTSGRRQDIEQEIDDLIGQFTGGDHALGALLLSHVDERQFYDWHFSLDHLSLRYGITYDGVDLENLSPGTRGIVLLILYLEMDKDDVRPLIIDQPEGNLDNSSIYHALVPYIRSAKKRRQIILITHNPNLVVTTDAEQVIVAEARKEDGQRHPTIAYRSGALEGYLGEGNTRENVCRILEGGEAAFAIREKKYAFRLR